MLDADCVFDVGANAGQFAYMLRKNVRYDERIISIEPNPEMAALVWRAASRDSMWSVEEIALSDENGTASFNVMADSQFCSLGTPRHDKVKRFISRNEVERTVSVSTETLSTAFERLKQQYKFSHPFLKLDTQGFDVTIVQSGDSIPSEFADMQSELSIRHIYHKSVDFREAILAYNSLGFELSALGSGLN